MTTPVLSVVITVYNRPREVMRAVDSVLAQDVEDVEILVVDDASSQPVSDSALREKEHHVRIVRHNVNRGAAAARNTGMAQARGEWLAFLDSDDIWLPGTLLPRMNAAEALRAGNPLTVHVTGFRLFRFGKTEGEVRIPMASADPLHFASGCWFAPGSTALFRREPILNRVGGQDESLRRFEDNDWFLRIALAGGRVERNPIVAANVHIGAKPSPAVIESNGAILTRKHAQAIADEPLRRAVLCRLNALVALELASACWYAGERPRAVINLMRSLSLKPRYRLQLEEFWEIHTA